MRVLVLFDVPPVWLATFLGIAWLQTRVWPPGEVPALLVLAGLALAGTGVVVLAGAAWPFLRERTSIVPRRRPSALITDGLYRFSRNPIYLADALILAGGCLAMGAWSGLVLVPAFLLWIERRFIRDEEAGLAAAFGPEFEAYRKRVRRWI